ncbi:MAG: tetratricopeptide repeat protein [Pseudomonadales bacterium]|nr:tetratricopeptide repeat protein [Pseudomonadales bacterium]MCP5345492.1 tetratricopeptide repeat protein [Pseudomonadales bacterium]
MLIMAAGFAQDRSETASENTDTNMDQQLDALQIPPAQMPLCFGMRDITDPEALAVCDALNLEENVRARELSENWVRAEPDNPAAQFALAEVLYTVEANLPRALFHLRKAEELTNYRSLGRALASGNIQWHYLTLSQLSFIYQIIGDQENALAYLDKIEEIYGQDVESLRGWPLIKMGRFEAARESANKVLQTSSSERERARAWNTLCAVELASLRPNENIVACDRAIDEDENIASSENDGDTVYLTNASEVALSLLEMEEAENFLDRATRVLNPESVADPWIYKLYITMNQGRFEEAREAMDRMLLWRENQVPVVTVMNRAEHLMVSASFLILSGQGEQAARLTSTALSEPDRNGSFSADDAQKDSVSALLHMLANETWYQVQLEQAATMDFMDRTQARLAANRQRFAAWLAARHAASLFADEAVLLNRLRPYAPLDVHIPEWIEPEIVRLLGTGVMSGLLERARTSGAFLLNEGYYFSYATEIAALKKRPNEVLENGLQALELLPDREVLLRARLQARIGASAWEIGQRELAVEAYQKAMQLDPGILRRLDASLPITFANDDSELARATAHFMKQSPRFREVADGFPLEVSPDGPSVCLYAPKGEVVACFTHTPEPGQSARDSARQLVLGLHQELFDLGYGISSAQMALLRGSSVIMQSRSQSGSQTSLDRFTGQ